MQQWKLSSIAENGAVWSSMYTQWAALDWREMIKIAAFIWRQSYVSYQWVISDSSVFHKYYMRLFTYSVRDTYANIFFSVIFSDT